jgi:dephospho-CoA kinase
MTIIGITGISGAGKSTVAGILKQEYQALVIDVDRVGHQVLAKDKNVRKKVLKTFGTINRKKLGPIVFAEQKKLKKLNGIIHPIMVKRIKAILAKNKSKNLIVIDAALLFQLGLNKLCDQVIFVDAPKKVIQKKLKNQGLTAVQIKQRLEANKKVYTRRKQCVILKNY